MFPTSKRFSSASLINLSSLVAPQPPPPPAYPQSAAPAPDSEQKKSLAPTKTLTKDEFFPGATLNPDTDETPSRGILMPENPFKIAWDLLGIGFIVYQAVMIPYEVGFNQPETQWRLILNNIIQGFFVLDILFAFNTAFYQKGNIVAKRRVIGKHYIQTWLFLDLVTVLPYDYIVAGISGNSDSGSNLTYQAPQMARIFKMVNFIRFLRLIRLAKLKKLILVIEDYISSQSIATFVMVLKLIITAFFMAHWTACAWYLVSYLDSADHPETWLLVRGLYGEDKTSEAYVYSLYWAVTTTMTIGYGDIHAITNNEMVCAIFAMGLGSGVFAYIVGKLGGIVNKRSERENQHREKVLSLNSFMKQKDLPNDVRFRVRRYLDYIWERQASSKMEEDAIMNLLSEPLKEQIYTHTRGPVFKTYSVFESFDLLFLASVSKLLRQEVFAPGNDILEEGERSTNLYFIISGTVDIWHKASSSSFKELNKEAYFGEIGFFSKLPRQASARCLTFVNLFVLPRDKFEEMLKTKPEAKEVCRMLEEKSKTGDFTCLRVACYICKTEGHVATGCKRMVLTSMKDQFKAKFVLRRSQKTVNVNEFTNPNFDRKDKRVRRDAHYGRECVVGRQKGGQLEPRLIPMIDKYEHEVEGRHQAEGESDRPAHLEAAKPKLDIIIETEPDLCTFVEDIGVRKAEFDVSLINPSGKTLVRQNATWTQGSEREDVDRSSEVLHTVH